MCRDSLPYQDSLQNLQRYVVRMESYLAALAPQMKVAEHQMMLRLLDDQITYVSSLMYTLQQHSPSDSQAQDRIGNWGVLFLHLQALRGLVAEEQATSGAVLPALNNCCSISRPVPERHSVA
jgi:hypothetical protein